MSPTKKLYKREQLAYTKNAFYKLPTVKWDKESYQEIHDKPDKPFSTSLESKSQEIGMIDKGKKR